MSENENIENVEETEVEMAETAEEAVEVAEAETVAEELAEPEEEAKPRKNLNEDLINKIKRAENLLFRRRMAMERAAEEKAGQAAELARAIKLLELKPKMEQKEMADLLGIRLRELDALLAEAEKCDIVSRIEPDEPDMRKVVVFADEDAINHVDDIAKKDEPLVPGLSNEEIEELFAQLDKVIAPLEAMGLGEDRGPRGGRDDRGPRGGFGGRGGNDRGPRGPRPDGDRSHGKFGAPRMGFGGSRGGHSDRGPRGGFGGRDDRGGRGGFGGRDDRGSRGGFGGGRGGNDRGGRGGYGGRGGNDRGGRGGYGGRDRY